MSKSTTSDSIESSHQSMECLSNLQDPLPSLPNELFTFMLSFLSPSGIAQASAINREWRRSAHSDPTLFTTVDLTSKIDEDDEMTREEDDVESDKIIQTLLRLSQLSNHRLKDVSLNLTSFYSDLRFYFQHKKSFAKDDSISGSLFNALNHSSATLTRLNLQTPIFDLEKETTLDPSDPLMMVIQILSALGKVGLPSLKEVKIDASTLCPLVSQSESKQLSVINNATVMRAGSDVTPMKISRLIRTMNKFTGGGISHIEGDFGMVFNEEIRKELWSSSRQSLVELNIYHANFLGYSEPILELLTNSENISVMSMKLHSEIDLDAPFSGRLARSQLKVFKLHSDDKVEVGLPLFNWLGNQLEELDLFPLQLSRDIGDSFFKLFQPFSHSLKKLVWNGPYLDSGGYQSPSGSLTLPLLAELSFEGHIDLVNFILQVEFSSLQKLYLVAYQCDSDEYINHKNVLKALTDCKGTLKSIWIRESLQNYPKDLREGFEQEEKVIKDLRELETIDKSVFLGLAETLVIQIRSDVFATAYSSVTLPEKAKGKLIIGRDFDARERTFEWGAGRCRF